MDPDSPPGVEYALPLDRARDQAAGSAAADRNRSSPAQQKGAPAFGRGITARAAADEPRSRDADPDRRSSTGRSVAPALPQVSSAQEATGPSILFSLIGAFAVLLAGGLIALSLRRRRPTV